MTSRCYIASASLAIVFSITGSIATSSASVIDRTDRRHAAGVGSSALRRRMGADMLRGNGIAA